MHSTTAARARGFALPAIIMALAIAGIVAGVVGSGTVMLARMSRDATYSDGARILVRQAGFRLVTESADLDADGFPEAPPMDTTGSNVPSGGGNIPSSSAAPKSDAWGTPLGYCSWDNGSSNSSTGRITGDNPATQSSVVFAVISAGPNKTFETSCAQARAGTPQGDDIVMVYSTAQINQGVGGTVYWGDPVTDYTALNALPAAALHTGEQRILLSTGQTYRWTGSAWASVNGISYVDGSGHVAVGPGVTQGQTLFATLTADKGSSGEAVRVGSGSNDQSVSFGGKANITTTGNAVSLVLNANGQSNQLFLSSNGNMGLGTTAPTQLLHINSGVGGVSGLRLEKLDGSKPANGGSSATTDYTRAIGTDAGGNVFVTNAIASLDSRAVDYLPTDRLPGLYADFRANGSNGLVDGGAFNGVLTFRPYGAGADLSGGNPSQLAFTQNGNLWTRIGTGASTWSSWKMLLTSSNAWSTTGNAGTVPGTNFVGTTDNVDLVFKTNATEVLRISKTGNVGVGTATPFSGLDVVNGLAVGAYAGTVPAPPNGMIVSGNVGIATASPGAMLDVAQSGGPSGSNAALLLRAGNSSSYFGNSQILMGYSGSPNYQHAIKSRHSSGAATGNGLDFYLWNYGTDSISSVGTKQVMTLEGTGNVGIGTTSPTAMLDVAQTGGPSGTSTALALRAGNAGSYFGNNQVVFGYYGGPTYQHAIKTRHNSGGATGNDIDFYVWNYGVDALTAVGTKQVMTIDGAGRVGVGTTGPLAGLHVQAYNTGISYTPNVRTAAIFEGSSAGTIVDVTGPTATQSEIWFSDKSTQAKGRVRYELGLDALELWSSSTERVRIDSVGNMGVGTTSPLSKLDVAGGVALGTYAGTAAAPTNGLIVSGNVGVGTNAPTTNLHVNSGVSGVSGLRLQMLDGSKPPNGGSTATSANTRAIGTDASGYVYTTNALGSLDSRSVDYLPSDRPNGLYVDFRQNSVNGLSDGGAFNGVLTFRSYGASTDMSGGYPSQLGFSANGNLWLRQGSSASTWGTWKQLMDSGSGWTLTGNAGTNASTNFIGTTDAVDFVTKTNNIERMRITSSGNVGIGTSAPVANLQVQGLGTVASPTTLLVTGASGTGGDARIVVSQTLGLFQDLTLLVAGTDSRSDGLTANDAYITTTQALDLRSRGNGSTLNTGITVGATSVANPYANITFLTAVQNSAAVERMRIDALGNVGIGTTSPDTTLDISGSTRTGIGPVKTYHNVASIDTGTTTGTLAITLPKTISQTMLHIKVSGYNYTPGTGAWTVQLGGYIFSDNKWYNTSAWVDGQAPFSNVRFTTDANNAYILLGTTSTTWTFPAITISEVNPAHTSTTGWGSGWTMAFLASEPSYTQITTPTVSLPILQGGNSFGSTAIVGTNDSNVLALRTAGTERMRIDTSGNVGIGTTSPLALLDVGGHTRQVTVSQGATTTERFYPNVISSAQNTTVTGAWVVHTPVPRTSGRMFKIRVHGYLYGGNGNNRALDFTVFGYPYNAQNSPIDGQPGHIINTDIMDLGDDGLPKYLGVDANNNVAIAFGSTSTSLYFGRVSVDAWLTLGTSDLSTGWSIDQNTTAGFGWNDLIGPMTPNSVPYLTGLGTQNYVAKFGAGGKTLGSSQLFDNGTGVGINTSSPASKLDVSGNVSVGTYAGSTAAPANGMIVSGNVGIGTSNPTQALDVNGNVKALGFVTSQITNNIPFVIRGEGYNNPTNRLVKLGGTTVYNSGTRGLALVIVDKATMTVVSSTIYDTYAATANSDNLATALNGITAGQIGILANYDAWSYFVTSNLRAAFLRLGLTKAYAASSNNANARVPYAAIFEGASNNETVAKAVEVAVSNTANQPYAEIRGWLTDGGFVATGGGANALFNTVGTASLIVSDTGSVGIGTTAPLSTLDVQGSLALGSYAGTNAAPYNGLIVSGKVGLGTTSPQSALDVFGAMAVGSYAGVNAAPSGGLIVSGYAGFGTNAPGQAVDVAGNVRVSGNFDYGQKLSSRTYAVNTNTPASILDGNGALLALNKSYLLEAYVEGTATPTGAKAVVWTDVTGTTFNMTPLYEAGKTSNHVQLYLLGGVPTVGLYNYTTSLYSVRVKVTETNITVRSTGPWDMGLVYQTPTAMGIGTTNPGYKLEVAGAVGATAFTNTSDLRFKRNIANLNQPLAHLLRLHGVSYLWRKEQFPSRGFDDKPQIGFIAQEMEQVLPELVHTAPDGYKSVAYMGVIPLIAEAVKELNASIGPLLPLAAVADKLQLSADLKTLEIHAPVKLVGNLLVAGDVRSDTITTGKLTATEVETGKLKADRVDTGSLRASRVSSGDLQFGLVGGAQQDLLDLPQQSSYMIVVQGADGSFVHATVLNTGGVLQITAKQQNGLDLYAVGNRLRVVNTSVQNKLLAANWVRVG